MATSKEEASQSSLANRLKDTRDYLNLSQAFVSEQTGIPRSAISDIERGVRKVDSLELAKLSKLYRFPVSYFLGQASDESAASVTLHALARTASELTDKDREEVLRFATFLRHYAKPKEKAKG